MAHEPKYCCSEKAISITYSLCVCVCVRVCVFVALDTQHEMRMRYVILLPVACPAVKYFPTLSHKREDFQLKKKVTERKTYISIFSAVLV